MAPVRDALSRSPERAPSGLARRAAHRRRRGQPRDPRTALRADDGLRDLWVEGEVGRVTVSTAGHAYFTLKDARAQLQCVWFRDERVRSPFQPQTGLQVVAHGRMDLFEPQGALQLYVDVAAAVRVRRPRGPVRAAEGPPRGRRACSTPRGSARCRRGRGRSPSSRRRPAPSGATCATSSPAAGRWPGWSSSRARSRATAAPASIVAALRRLERWIDAVGRRGPGRRGAGGDHPRPGRGLAGGPVVVQRRARRAGGRRAPGARSCAAWGTRWTSRWPTSPPTSGPRRRPPRPSWWCRTASRPRGGRPGPGAPCADHRGRARHRRAAGRGRGAPGPGPAGAAGAARGVPGAGRACCWTGRPPVSASRGGAGPGARGRAPGRVLPRG